MILWFMSSNPMSDSVLTAQSLEPASDSVCVCLSLSAPPLLTLCLSKINKHLKNNFFFNWSVFQVFNIVIQQFYTLCNDSKVSIFLLLCNVITILLTIFPVPYFSSVWLIYFITGSSYLLIPFTYFSHSPLPLPGQRPVCSRMYESVSVLFVCLFCVLFFVY